METFVNTGLSLQKYIIHDPVCPPYYLPQTKFPSKVHAEVIIHFDANYKIYCFFSF